MALRASRLAAVVALAVVTAACHSGSSRAATSTTRASISTSTSSSTPAPSTTSTSRPTATAAPPAPPPTAACGASQQPDTSFTSGAPAQTVLLSAVTVRRSGRCTDEIVFGFAPQPAVAPGVSVKIVNPPFTLAGNGAAVTVAGRRFYQVRFAPAATFDFNSGRATYAGPANFVPPGTVHVRQLVETDAFEGVVTWVIGVDAGAQFVPAVKASPPSLTLTF